MSLTYPSRGGESRTPVTGFVPEVLAGLPGLEPGIAVLETAVMPISPQTLSMTCLELRDPALLG